MDVASGLRLGSVRGIPVRIHLTFVILLPVLAYAFGREFAAAARSAGIAPDALRGSPWLWGLGISLALFSSVLLHEFAHALYAVRRGGRVAAITLLPIGGVTQITEAPPRVEQEAMMALVGPLASLVLGGLFHAASRALMAMHQLEWSFGLHYLGYLNVALAVFNLIPAFPMDGGRILRSVLARRRSMVRATQLAASVGKACAAVFAAAGFLTANFVLMLVGFFVFVGAASEERMVLVRALLGDLRVRDVMTPRADTVPVDASLYDVGERMLREGQETYPVADDGHLVGVVTLDRVVRVPLAARHGAHAGDVVERVPLVDPEDRVVDALRSLDDPRIAEIPVAHEGHLVGTVSRAQVAHGMRLRELEASQHGRGVTTQG